MSNVEAMCIMPRMDGLKIWRPTSIEAVQAAEKFNLNDRVDSLYLLSSGEFAVCSGWPSGLARSCARLGRPHLVRFWTAVAAGAGNEVGERGLNSRFRVTLFTVIT